MLALEQLFVDMPSTSSRQRQKVVVIYGMGGIGKTQLAVEFARKHLHRFSAVFWLDGLSEASLKQSFVNMARRLPRSELINEGASVLSHATATNNADVVMREFQRWLSMPSNLHWLLLIDNVDRGHHDKDGPQRTTCRRTPLTQTTGPCLSRAS